MVKQREIWIAVVDQRKGRILHICELDAGGFRCAEKGFIENRWEEHQHGRPSPRSGRTGHTYASRGHEDEEMMRRFAKEVSEWIDRVLQELRIEHLEVFAPTRFLGALRQHRASRPTKRAALNEADLGSMSDGEVVRHRAVAQLLA
jgi:protein required for attachment to host cells